MAVDVGRRRRGKEKRGARDLVRLGAALGRAALAQPVARRRGRIWALVSVAKKPGDSAFDVTPVAPSSAASARASADRPPLAAV